jgi:hypothetical protein
VEVQVLWRALAEVDESRNLWIAFGEEGQELWSVSDEELCGVLARKALSRAAGDVS